MTTSVLKLQEALTWVPPDLCRDDWWKIAAALKFALKGDGFALFDQWSQGGTKYDKASVRSTWKSTNVEGNASSTSCARA